jgi:hypothetical protein
VEDDVKKGIIFTIGVLVFLAGCGNQNKTPGIPLRPKWHGGPAYHIAFDTQPTKPNKSGITIPPIKYTADPNAPPDALEKRATLVVRIDTSSLAKKQPQMMDQIIMGAVDISGAEGALPADYMDATDKSLATLLEEYCINGKVKISVVLTRSSLSSTAGNAEIEDKRLSDWLPIELVFKSPLRAC